MASTLCTLLNHRTLIWLCAFHCLLALFVTVYKHTISFLLLLTQDIEKSKTMGMKIAHGESQVISCLVGLVLYVVFADM